MTITEPIMTYGGETIDVSGMRFRPGDRVRRRDNRRIWGYVRGFTLHPWYGPTYLIWWGHTRGMGDGWRDSDLA